MRTVQHENSWEIEGRRNRGSDWCLRFARLTGVLVALIGIAVLLGWGLQIELLKRLAPEFVAMNPATAVAFVFAAASLLLVTAGEASGTRRNAAVLCAGIVALIGALKLLSFADLDARVDQILFHSQLTGDSVGHVNRMAPNTALCFVLVGGALLLMDRRVCRLAHPGQMFSLTTTLMALLAIIGYTYSATVFYGVASFIPMAVHTAFGFLFISLGVFVARPGEGFMSILTSHATGGVLARRVLPAVIVIPPLLGWLYLTGNQAGLFTSETGISLLVVATIVLFLLIVWWTANQLQRSDASRASAEQEVREREQLLRSIIDNSNCAIYVKNRGGRYTLVNEPFASMVGRSVEEIAGKSDREIFPAPLAEELERVDGEVLARGNHVEFEHDIPHDEGTRTYLTTKFPLRDVAGQTTALCGISTDITERTHAEQALQDHAAAINDLYHNAPCGYHSLNSDGVFIEVNETELAWLGYARDEVIGKKTFADLLTPESRKLFAERFPTFKKEGEIREVEFEMARKDGSILPVLLSATAVRDEDGNFVATRSTVFDITERKKAHAATARLASIVEHTHDAVISEDLEGRIFSWNRGAERLFGFTAEEVVGRPISVLVPPELPNEIPQLLERISRGEIIEHYETVRMTKGGERRHMSLTLSPIKDGRGEIVGVSKIARDITSRKETEEQLEKAKVLAEDANRTKSEFLANMSHEIRTPMMAVIGYADLLLDVSQTTSDRLNAVNVIRRNANHLLTIINDILDLSKIEAGELNVETVNCSPCQVIYEVVSLMRVRAAEKNLEFKTHLEGSIPETIQSDPTRLRQILINLVGNAIKFTESGWVKLIVELIEPEDDGGEPMLRFDVIDTGIGMSEQQVANLFRAFGQADASTTREFGGTGLGLVISQRLANMLGGEIEVDSTPGRGSTFSVYVRTGSLADVKRIDDCREVVDVSEPDGTDREAITLNGRILLAEDGLDNRQILAQYLRLAGAEVSEAENGRVACNLAIEAMRGGQPFDLVVMDMQMPELDGYGAASKLRTNGYDRPIVALTAHAMADDRQKCLQAGCTDYLSKPVTRDMLLRTLALHLGAESSGEWEGAATEDARKEDSLLSELTDEAIMPYLNAFIDSMPSKINELEELLAAEDLETLRSVIHQLKGSGGLFGFIPITDKAAEVEELLQHGRPMSVIRKEMERLTAMMERASRSKSHDSSTRPGK